jgi:GntR family transcriptional regulator
MDMERGDIPRYIQLAATLRERILSGEIPPTQPMPSTRSLQQEYGLALNTITKAYRLLRDEGLVRPVRGLGWFPTFPEDRPPRP